MPGSGDPSRLRGAVPDLPPRLLRMLRPRPPRPTCPRFIPLLRRDGMSPDDVDRVFATFNVTQFDAERSTE